MVVQGGLVGEEGVKLMAGRTSRGRGSQTNGSAGRTSRGRGSQTNGSAGRTSRGRGSQTNGRED